MMNTISTESPKAFFLFLCLSMISVSPSVHTEGVIVTPQSIEIQKKIDNAYQKIGVTEKKVSDKLLAIEKKMKK